MGSTVHTMATPSDLRSLMLCQVHAPQAGVVIKFEGTHCELVVLVFDEESQGQVNHLYCFNQCFYEIIEEGFTVKHVSFNIPLHVISDKVIVDLQLLLLNIKEAKLAQPLVQTDMNIQLVKEEASGSLL